MGIETFPCPKCHKPLNAIRLHEVLFQRCVHCGGALFSSAQIKTKIKGIDFASPAGGPSAQSAEKIVCPKCSAAMNEVRMTKTGRPMRLCGACDLVWSSRESLTPVTEHLHNLNAEHMRRVRDVRLVISVVFTLSGLSLLYFWVRHMFGTTLAAVMMTSGVGIPAFYFINLAIWGKFINLEPEMDGEAHSDIEDLGEAAAEMWQEARPWITVFAAGMVFFTVALFLLPMPRAHLFRFIAWLQAPASSYLDIIDSKNKTALERSCDWNLRAYATDKTVFTFEDESALQAICKSAGRIDRVRSVFKGRVMK